MESQNVSFRVAREDLVTAVAWVARNLPTKPTQPVLRAMLITADDEGLELAGYDYDVSTRVRLSAEVSQPGRIAVAGKLLSEITGSLPNKPVDFRIDGSKAFVTCGSSRFELPLIPLDDYPMLPKLPAGTGSINAKLFTEAVSQVASAAGKDDSLPMLTGVSMEIVGNQINLAATDRFRLALRTFEWEANDPELNVKLLIPARTLLDNARSLDSGLNDSIDIAVGTGDQVGREGLFGVHTDNRETTTRLLDADFPNIAPLLPKEHTAIASVEIAPLVDAIRRVSLVAERNAQIVLHFSEGQVILTAGATEAGHAEETLPCAFTGKELTIAFNPGYLKDGLSVVPTSRAVFGFTEPSRPAIMIPEPEEMPSANENGIFQTPDTYFTYLLMPVRLPG
ncbi:DNA polymerase III, beta chain [Corynebacterium glutamicum MB001]|uniref:Beta sliding clamp n=4 Tax=Corynebacterium TaxID=1716 RepID=Q8NUD6_CORGL|nr:MULTISPECIES: DNA polymerase III subunit beta [Corynebacterium]AGN17597.1 DNA polymerase III subunit beta [Corynebacterium glutamicum SCgG1]AGN20620.1 DNA polymerase III subunit beta [Corynebacterium glutamicum SCgG2]AGT04014.1 DNA polymerase III, beta chain [Corynebacterium glutamicum MB001]AIK83714.1 DNA polymerase III subunit beta [Corynebacterium glutamicum]AIK86474.1 DNA polymerase III subunit beta [Corynebacterium glutamicum]